METHDEVLRAEIRRALEVVGDVAVPNLEFHQLPVRPHSETPARRRVVVLVAAAAVVALVAGLVWVAAVRTPDTSPAGPGPEIGGLPTDWVKVASSPLSPRTNAVVAWTGSQILVAGGNTSCPQMAECGGAVESYSDGALYDPSTDRWSVISPAPAPITWGYTATVPGTVYVLTTAPPSDRTGASRALYAYSVNDDLWERIALPSNTDDWDIEAVGTTVVVYPGSDEFERERDYVLDTDTSTWELLPDDPLPLAFGRQMMWNGRDLYLFAAELVDSLGADGPPPLMLAAYDFDSDSWRQLPAEGVPATGPWLNQGDLLINPRLGCGWQPCVPFGGVFDIGSGTWSQIPDAPQADERMIFFSSGAIGEAKALVYGDAKHLYDAEQQTWVEMPSLPNDGSNDDFQRVVHSVGADAFVFGGSRFDGNDGVLLSDAWIWRTARNERWWQPTDLPVGFELTDTFTNPDGLLRQQEYLHTDGRAITVRTSTLPVGLPSATSEISIDDVTWQIAQLVVDDRIVWTTLFRTDGTNEWLVTGEGLDVAALELIVASLHPVSEPPTSRGGSLAPPAMLAPSDT